MPPTLYRPRVATCAHAVPRCVPRAPLGSGHWCSVAGALLPCTLAAVAPRVLLQPLPHDRSARRRLRTIGAAPYASGRPRQVSAARRVQTRAQRRWCTSRAATCRSAR
eukprot:scaffold131879_cov60-Phaeocystis_antarctica.AAC.4